MIYRRDDLDYVLIYPCGCTEILGPIAPVWFGTGKYESADREARYEEHAKICYKKEKERMLGYKRDMQYKMQFEEEQKQQSALDTQVGGDHYKQLKIEPTVYCQTNGFRHGESSAIKYISRYHVKRNPIDLDKAIHFLQIVKEIDNVREG